MRTDDVLQNLVKNQEVARAAFSFLRDNLSSEQETNLKKLAQHIDFNYGDVLGLAKELDRIQVGRLLIGRHGKETRFQWRPSLREVVERATGAETADANGTIVNSDSRSLNEIINEAKAHLSRASGVSPDRIDITIRW